MERNGYSPFDKNLDEIKTADLAVLKTVPEGWYVEYKEKFPDQGSVAKSISALANTYGGWLFYGIKESPDGKRLAADSPGIDVQMVPTNDQQIRQAATEKINPTPFFVTKVLYGPDDSIGLSAEKAIILVHVPQGVDAPYVHSTGKIYRRVGDSSEPTHENDRHTLDLLWTRGAKYKADFARFVRQRPGIRRDEESVTFIKLLFFFDPWIQRRPRRTLSLQQFAELMRDSSPGTGGVPFDNFFPHRRGLVARQIFTNDPSHVVFTWKYFIDGTNEIFLPLAATDISDPNQASHFLKGYTFGEQFLRVCHDKRVTSGTLIDVSLLYSLLSSILQRLFSLRILEGEPPEAFWKLRIWTLWGRIPFLDLPQYVDFVKENGIPLIQDDTCLVPPGNDPESCHQLLRLEEEEGNPAASSYINAAIVLTLSASAFGISPEIFGFYPDHNSELVSQLIQVANRAEVVARTRRTFESS